MISKEMSNVIKQKFPNHYSEIERITTCFKNKEIDEATFFIKLERLIEALNDILAMKE
jgi:hypothetical protein